MCVRACHVLQCACTTCVSVAELVVISVVCARVCVLLQKLTFWEAVGQWCSAKLLDARGGDSC